VANAILFRFIVAAVLVVPGWFFIAQLSGGGGGTPPPGSRGAQAAELGANAALVQAAQLMGTHHQTYGTFAGADLSSIAGTRLVRADTTTFCAEAGEASWLYHLDGTATQDNSWNWGAVKGPCPAA
jgi:hypothetical protein